MYKEYLMCSSGDGWSIGDSEVIKVHSSDQELHSWVGDEGRVREQIQNFLEEVSFIF